MKSIVRQQLQSIVRKILSDAEHAEMPLHALLRSPQPVAWFINSDPRWTASLTSLNLRFARREGEARSLQPKYRFELTAEGALVLRATLKGGDVQVDSYSPGPWQAWFEGPRDLFPAMPVPRSVPSA